MATTKLLTEDKNGNIVPTAQGMSIAAIRKLVEKRQEKAFPELGYIEFMWGLDSPYRDSLSDAHRADKVREVVFGSEKWTPSRYFADAEAAYIDYHYNNNVAMKLLVSAERAVREMITYFENVDFETRDPKGQLMYEPKAVIGTIKDLGPLMASIKKLKEEVKKQVEAETSNTRGGVQETPFNT